MPTYPYYHIDIVTPTDQTPFVEARRLVVGQALRTTNGSTLYHIAYNVWFLFNVVHDLIEVYDTKSVNSSVIEGTPLPAGTTITFHLI